MRERQRKDILDENFLGLKSVGISRLPYALEKNHRKKGHREKKQFVQKPDLGECSCPNQS